MAQRSLPAEGIAAFLDVETTGLSPNDSEIIQLAIASFRFKRNTGEILEILDFYVGFNEPVSGYIPRSASRVNHITMDDVAGHSLNEDRINSIVDSSEFIVAHNAQFDRSFCLQLFPWASSKPWKCSMRHIDWMQHGHETRKLQVLLHDHGIAVDNAHRADADVRAAVELLNHDIGNGQRYFQQVIRHRAMSRPKGSREPMTASKQAAATSMTPKLPVSDGWEERTRAKTEEPAAMHGDFKLASPSIQLKSIAELEVTGRSNVVEPVEQFHRTAEVPPVIAPALTKQPRWRVSLRIALWVIGIIFYLGLLSASWPLASIVFIMNIVVWFATTKRRKRRQLKPR